MTTPLTLSPLERDALYQSIVAQLTGIDYIYTAIEKQEFETADKLSREFSDLLRLIQDLGWGDRGTQAVLTAPPDVLHRALSLLREKAETEDREEAAEREELAARGERNQIVRKVCARQIAGLQVGKGTERRAERVTEGT